MLGELYNHEGGGILRDTGDCESWKGKRERNDLGGRRKVRRRKKESKNFPSQAICICISRVPF